MKLRGALAVRWSKLRPETEIGHNLAQSCTLNFVMVVGDVEKNSDKDAPSLSKIAYHFRRRRAVLISGQNRKKMKEKETKKTEACKNDNAEQKRTEMQLHGSE